MDRIRGRQAQAGAALLAACAAAIANSFGAPGWVLWCGGAALALYVAQEFPRNAVIGKAIAVAAGVAAALVLGFSSDAAAVLRRGLAVATILAAFVTAMNLLRETAQSSALIRRCGINILSQPPRRQYGAMTAAGNLFGILAAFGVVNILGVMIVRAFGAARRRGDAGAAAGEKRALLALLRGFGHTALWSPVAVPFAVVAAGYASLRWQDIALPGMATAALLLGLGWLMDSISGGGARRGDTLFRNAPPARVHLRLALLILALFAVLFTADGLIRKSFILAAILGVPVFSVLWMAFQGRRHGPRRMPAAVLRRLGRVVRVNFARQRLETTVIASAGFLGAVLAASADTAALAAAIAGSGVPPVLIAIAAVWIMLGLGHLGITPVVVTTLMTASMPDPAALGIPLELFALALLGAWGLTQQSSPVNLAVLIIGQLAGKTSHVVGQRWNGAYSGIGGLVFSVWIYFLFSVAYK